MEAAAYDYWILIASALHSLSQSNSMSKPDSCGICQSSPAEHEESIEMIDLDGEDQHNDIFSDFFPPNGFTHRIVAPASYGRTPVHVGQDHDIEQDNHESNEDCGSSRQEPDDEEQPADKLDPRQNDRPQIEEPVGHHR